MFESRPITPHTTPPTTPQPAQRRPTPGVVALVTAWVLGIVGIWWQAAQLAALCLSPSAYRGRNAVLVREAIVMATVPLFGGFVVLASLLAVVVIRIVLAAAADYGLSQFALNLLVRTLVLEVVPLLAAAYVAFRYTFTQPIYSQGTRHPHWRAESALDQAMPAAVGAIFSVIFLATTSGVLVSLIAYVSVFGLSPWGVPSFTSMMGSIFTPTVSAVLALKTIFFAGAVGIVPMIGLSDADTTGLSVGRFARLFAFLLLIEVLSLVGNYY